MTQSRATLAAISWLVAFPVRTRNFAAVLIASALLSSVAAAQVPEVIGPIPAVGPPGTDVTHNYPQLASAPNFDLSSRGYIEGESFSSKAQRRNTRFRPLSMDA